MVSRLIHEVSELTIVPELNLSGLFLGRDLHISYCLWLYNLNSLRWFNNTLATNKIRYTMDAYTVYDIPYFLPLENLSKILGFVFLVHENYLENIHQSSSIESRLFIVKESFYLKLNFKT